MEVCLLRYSLKRSLKSLFVYTHSIQQSLNGQKVIFPEGSHKKQNTTKLSGEGLQV